MISSSAAKALSHVQSGHRVFIHGGAATPHTLIEALVAEAPRLKDVEIMHMHTHGEATYACHEYASSFRVSNLFVGANMRPFVDYDRVDYIPCFLSEIPLLFRKGIKPLDVALIHVSPPDRHGFCSLGTSVDVAKAAVDTAKIVIAQVNPRMPRLHGDGIIHVSKIHHLVEVDEALFTSEPKSISPEEVQIGKHVAGLIEDGSNLQMGIGAIPDAVLSSLQGHKNLGIHTEMWSEGALPLLKSGVVNNSNKKFHKGKTVSSFIMGSQDVFDFIDDNPSVLNLDVAYVNNPAIIARNPKVVAINSAVEIDLTGQVCADSIGHQLISGVGGQVDFIRGAALSEGGKPIIAMTTRTKKGQSRLVTTLKPGAGVVTTRYHVHYIVTEYGIAHLVGKTLSERAHALIKIAHPDDREALERSWYDVHKKFTSHSQ